MHYLETRYVPFDTTYVYHRMEAFASLTVLLTMTICA